MESRSSQRTAFERQLLPHLDAAFNLARWLAQNEHDAEDLVQEAYLRALQFFDGYHSDSSGRAWLLKIVRNTFLTWRAQNRKLRNQAAFDEKIHSDPHESTGPVVEAIKTEDRGLVRDALEKLPLEFREILVLRDLEGLSYNEIGAVTDLPLGTVMSRIARARERLKRLLAEPMRKEA